MRSLFLALFCFACWVLPAQENLDVRQWLLQKEADIATAFDQSIRSNNFRPAWIERLELRSHTDEFSFERQEYLIRLSPASPGIRKAQKNLIELHTQDANTYQAEIREELIKIVLEDFLEIYQLENRQRLRTELKNILEDQKRVANLMVQDPDFNPKKLLEIEEELHDLTLAVYKTDKRIEQLFPSSSIPKPSYNQLIEVSQIAASIGRLKIGEQDLSTDTKYQLENKILDAEIGVEKAEKRRLLDFVQFRYSGPHDDVFNERLSVSLGLELPFSGSRKAKLERLEVEKWKLKQETQSRLRIRNLELKKAALEIDRLIQTYTFAQELLVKHEDEFERMETQSTQAEWKSPELLLYKKTRYVERKLDLLSLEVEIYEKYMNLLQKAGLCYDDSYIQYLVK